MTEALNESQLLNLHKYLHNPNIKFVILNGKRIPIFTNRLGLRFIQIGDIKYIQQNPNKCTRYGAMAKNGHTITWGIRSGKWDLVVDNKIEVFNG